MYIIFVVPLFHSSVRQIIDFPQIMDFHNWQGDNRVASIVNGVIATVISIVAFIISVTKRKNSELRKAEAITFVVLGQILLLVGFSVLVSIIAIENNGELWPVILFHGLQQLAIMLLHSVIVALVIMRFIGK